MAKHAYMKYPSQISRKSKRSGARTIGRILGTLFALIVFALVGLVVVLTVTEYHPKDTETVSIDGNAAGAAALGQEYSILTWNIGYGALSDDADFFMDGGHMIQTATEERVKQNMDSIVAEVSQINPSFAFFQEVDINSTRSYGINQVQTLSRVLPDASSCFAYNYKTLLVPVGIPPYGKVESGIQTLSTLEVKAATRLALPLSYSWPVSTAQLKRCELLTRIPIEGSTHELVLINEHPDAYTNEEKHAEQITRIIKTLQDEVAKGNYVIAGGDWNHHFSNIDSTKYPLLAENNWKPGELNTEDFGEGWQFLMDNRVPTSRLLDHPFVDETGTPQKNSTQFYMIDGFIVSNNVEVLDLETIDMLFKASDHNPVLLKFTLKE